MPIFPRFVRDHRASAVLLVVLAGLFLTGSSSFDPCNPCFWFGGASRSVSPALFVRNLGQSTDTEARFLAHSGGFAASFSDAGLTIDVRQGNRASDPVRRVGVQLIGSRKQATLEAREPLVTRVNYFLGSDSSRWITDVPAFNQVRYREVYPGVDAVYHGGGAFIEQDFEVQPGADPYQIRMKFQGADSVAMNPKGELEIDAAGRKLVWGAPQVYQRDRALRRPIQSRYRALANSEFGFEVGAYDPAKPLVIDPEISFVTYMGRAGNELTGRAVVDANGNVYTVGASNDPIFPASAGAISGPGSNGGPLTNAVVLKFDSSGTQLLYSTHIGGGEAEFAAAVALDAAGNVYLTGSTASPDYPTTEANRLRFTVTENDIGTCFITKLNATGNALVYSTYLGGVGRDACTSIQVDSTGAAYVAGMTDSFNFPTTPDVVQIAFRPSGQFPGLDAFVSKLNPAGSALVYSTFLGGSGNDGALALAIDTQNNAYVVGSTASANFPVTTGAYRTTFGGSGGNTEYFPIGDGFVAKLNSTATALIYSTYLGGSRDDAAIGLAVDAQGNAYVTGSTLSTNFPVTTGALQTTYRGAGGESVAQAGDAFVTKLNPAGSNAVYSTLLGGSMDDRGMVIAVDSAGSAWVSGNTLSQDFPVTPDALQNRYAGSTAGELIRSGDAFVAQVNPQGSALTYASYFGGTGNDWGLGMAIGRDGSVTLAGGTSSRDLPVTAGAFQRQAGGGDSNAAPMQDSFVVRFAERTGTARTSVAGYASAASYAGSGVAPGEIVTIVGDFMGPDALRTAELVAGGGAIATQVSGTRVLFDGVAAPIIYTSAKQVSAVVPYEVASAASTQLVVEYQGDRSVGVTIPVVRAKPGLFSADSSGRGPGAILNQNGTYNAAGNQALRGEVIVVFGTGEGQTTPLGVTGKLGIGTIPRPALPVSATIGGASADVAYVGGAPGLVAGLLQLNLRVPSSAPAGEQPLVVRIGEFTSQTGFTVFVASGSSPATAATAPREMRADSELFYRLLRKPASLRDR